MPLAIDVRNLNKSFGALHVVKDLSIRVEQGRITGFLGPNGSGKTTTLRMLCGLLTPDSGHGTALGLDIVEGRCRGEAPDGLHDPAFLALRRSHDRRESTVQRAYPRSRPAPAARNRCAGEAGPHPAAQAACRQTIGRLEATSRAGGGDAARTASASARRTDRRRRPAGAPFFLG